MKKTKTTNLMNLELFEYKVQTLEAEDLKKLKHELTQEYNISPDYNWEEDEEGYLLPPVDPHLGCYSYPMCDEAPQGCCVLQGDEVEPYGWRE